MLQKVAETVQVPTSKIRHWGLPTIKVHSISQNTDIFSECQILNCFKSDCKFVETYIWKKNILHQNHNFRNKVKL
jgi:hypothetical protein